MTDTAWHYVTFFPDQYASTQEAEEFDLAGLAHEIRSKSAPTREALPWLKLARFGEKRTVKGYCLRNNANVIEVSGVEAEHDAGTMPFDEALARLTAARVACLIYTSPSYIKGVKERWRVLAPFSRMRAPALRREMVAVLNGVLEGAVTNESFVLSQAFYYGRVGDNPDHRVEVVEGDFVDLRLDLLAGKRDKPGAAKRKPSSTGPAPAATPIPRGEAEAALAVISADCSYETWRDIGAALRHQFGEAGFDLFDDWSATAAGLAGDGSARYTPEKAQRQWDALHSITDISIGTLFHHANKADPTWRERYEAKRVEPEAFGAKLAEVAVLHGVVIPPTPQWREVYPNGAPRASLYNACVALVTGGFVGSYDVFHNKMYLGRGEAADALAPLPPFCGEVTDNRIALLRQWVSNTYGRDFTEKHVRDAVIASALAHPFNPVTDMLAEAEAGWDGTPRLDRLACDFFGCADTPLNRAMARKTLIAAVARARRPGCKFDTILVLEGPEGWNKSSAWAVLAGEGNFSDERIIGSAAREVVEQLAGIWIHENADLAGMRKAEVETVKAYASRQVDRARPAYGRFLIEQPRHSIEVGTTNNHEYMQSQTGNRRFWPMRLERRIDLSQLRAARLQLWGEAAAADTAGESLVLDETLWGDAAIVQEARRVRDPWEEVLARLSPVGARDSVLAGVGMVGFGIVQVAGDEWRVATKDIFQIALSMPAHMLDDRHTKRLANAMRALGWTGGLIRFEDVVARGYRRKADGA